MSANAFRLFLAIVIVLALVGTAWMTRYEMMKVGPYPAAFDRWTGVVCIWKHDCSKLRK